MIILFLHCTPITSPILHSSFDPGFDLQLDAHIFITERGLFVVPVLVQCPGLSGRERSIDRFELEDGYSAE
ncbi:hypothetical protein CK203_038505 [Vitis vinifera]|uniref:Uncharacterized protein n=1 Tax=Vitis vinifera TaxID=29760 RepID=A0A438IRR3_VITVI|nr:hypothetical protein CK203_038505 [Vitis vinifera]